MEELKYDMKILKCLGRDNFFFECAFYRGVYSYSNMFVSFRNRQKLLSQNLFCVKTLTHAYACPKRQPARDF